jgi:hypothetical protein
MTCSRCLGPTHRDLPDKAERCSGCDRVPAACRCEPAIPMWVRRRNDGLLRAKELVA